MAASVIPAEAGTPGRKDTALSIEAPGRPLIYATTPAFLAPFGLESRRDLPGLDDLKAAGLLDPIDAAMEQLGNEELESEAEED